MDNDDNNVKEDSEQSNNNGPQPSEKLGSEEFGKDSKLETGEDDKAADSGKNKGSETKEGGEGGSDDESAGKGSAAKKVAGIANTGNRLRNASKNNGLKGAAVEAARIAAEEYANRVAPIIGKRAASWAGKKENRNKLALGAAALLLIPVAALVAGAVIIFSFMSDPVNFVWKALSDPKEKEFVASASQAGYGTVEKQSSILKKYGFIEKPNNNTAIAAPQSSQPKPGSLEEKLTKIDFKKASYQTGAGPACPVVFTYKELSNEKGQSRSVIDKAIQKNNNQEIPLDNSMAQYCLMKSMPIQNMLFRTENARSVNKYSGLEQNYAGNKDEINKLGGNEAKKYVYDKTYKRITEKNSGVQVDNPNVNDYIQNVKTALADGKNPNDIDSNFQFKADTISGIPQQDQETVSTMCTFTDAYLTGKNLRESLDARIKTAQRSSTKWGTLSSTIQIGNVSSKEIDASMQQIDNWAASTAYAQNVYGRSSGQLISPEALGNTSYGASYRDSIALLFDIKDKCAKLREKNYDFGGLLSLLGIISDQNKVLEQFKISYASLQKIIIDQSNGKFTSTNDFGLQQIMIGIIRTSAGSAVSGVEQEGWENFNNQSQGFRALSNMYMLRMGGRFLTKDEANSLSTLAENFRREEEQKNGLAYRLFDKDNIRSLANITQYETPRTPKEFNRETNKYVAKLTNPIKTMAELQSGFNQFALGKSNQAFAAGETGDVYMRLDTIGIPENVYKGVDQIKNSNEVQNILENGSPQQKDLLANFEKCSQENIPSKNYFVKQYKVDENGNVSNKVFDKDDSNYPIYPALSDKTESSFEQKKFYMTCEVYLMPPSEVDITPAQQEQLFGLKKSEVDSLVKKFQLYKYSNKLADLMVDLSSTDYNDKIYANSPGGSGGNAAAPDDASSNGIVGDIGLNSDSVPCPAGTNDLGVAASKYTGEAKKESGTLNIRLCQIPDIPGRGANTSGSIVDGGAVVNSRVAGAWQALAKAAKSSGVNLRANSSFRLFDSCGGTGDGSACAKPGKSPHQLGIAIDFADMSLKGSSTSSCSGRARLPNSPQWKWMFDNAERFGIEQYTFEAWHWDLLGGANRCNSKE